ncbi:MAG: hypothetical protein ABI680_01080 [Chthoniobacteraceae bacterium]
MRAQTWILGYHGCDREVGEAVLAGEAELRLSENDWDWLGTGIYFWENNARRALEWARFAPAHPAYFRAPVKEPFVIGAVIELGNCLDLLEAISIRVVEEAHEELKQIFSTAASPMPTNSGAEPDSVIRRLDCAVINYVHDLRIREGQPPFDSVRAAFVEGKPLYAGAGFYAQTHVQICVREAAQIIGYFRVKRLE